MLKLLIIEKQSIWKKHSTTHILLIGFFCCQSIFQAKYCRFGITLNYEYLPSYVKQYNKNKL